VPGAFESDKFSYIFELLAKDVFFTLRYNRDIAQAQCQQSFTTARIVQDIDNFVVNLLFRKKLFRSEAGTSSRL